MIELISSPVIVDAFLNDPAIYPDMGCPPNFGPITLAPKMGSPDYRVVGDAETALMLFHKEPKGWHKHNLFRANCRGAAALKMGREILEWFFANIGSDLFAETPFINRKARWFNRKIGFRSLGFRVHPMVGPVECFKHGGISCLH